MRACAADRAAAVHVLSLASTCALPPRQARCQSGQGFLTRDLIPDTQIEERFKAEGKVTVALDPHMNISVPEIDLGRGLSVGGGIEASADSRFLLNWEYSLLDARIIALGKKGSYAEWVIKEPRSMMGSVELTTVLAVPKGTTEVPLRVSGHYLLSRGIAWWKKETRVKIKGESTISLPGPV